jgi:hypothetical protein
MVVLLRKGQVRREGECGEREWKHARGWRTSCVHVVDVHSAVSRGSPSREINQEMQQEKSTWTVELTPAVAEYKLQPETAGPPPRFPTKFSNSRANGIHP